MKGNQLPYGPTTSAGKYQGVGMPAQYGVKKGGYADAPKPHQIPRTSAPLKF